MNTISEGICEDLYDPCTRRPSDLEGVERRIRELKQRDLPEKLIFPKEVKTRMDLLVYLLNRPVKPDDSLLQYTTNGQLYESYWDIVFSLGLMPEFPVTPDFYMYQGKIETLKNLDSPGFIQSPLRYLDANINQGSKSGASDITFVYKSRSTSRDKDACSSDVAPIPCEKYRPTTIQNTGPLFYFCSSKYFNKDETKAVDKFDIQNIFTAAKNIQFPRKIILLVKDRKAVESKLQSALRKYIAEEAVHVFGIDDLWQALGRLYAFVQDRRDLSREAIVQMLGLEEPMKPILQLRLHQHLAVMKISDAIRIKSKNNRYLVGIVPRGGKTYIAGGIIDKLQPRRAVVLLGATSETFSQFDKDLFQAFQNFRDYEIVRVKDERDYPIEDSKKYIFIMSVELFKGNGPRKLLDRLKSGEADLFICDEAHLKQVTQKQETAMKKSTKGTQKEARDPEMEQLQTLDQEFRDIPVVYMTGTYRKPMAAFRIPPENVILWDYPDIQKAKDLVSNETYFQENFAPYYDLAVDACGQSKGDIQEQYRLFPDLHFITTVFTDEVKDKFLKQVGGFPTLSHLFELERGFDGKSPDLWHTGFQNPGIRDLMEYLSRDAMKSVDHIAQRIGDRLRFVTSSFVTHTQLWFLPASTGKTELRMRALAGTIFQNPWFRKHFDILGVSSLEKKSSNQIEIDQICGTITWVDSATENMKQYIVDHEAMVRRNGKGLILLALNTLQVGISLPCVDVVVLLDDGKSLDSRIQKIYRALTESTHKKAGYIIDMNYFRTVVAQMDYEIISNTYRKGKTFSSDRKELLNRILDVYSVDDHRSILRTDLIEGLLPELQRIDPTKIRLDDAGEVLDQEIQAFEANYRSNYDNLLGNLSKEKKRTLKLRSQGQGVSRAKHPTNEVAVQKEKDKRASYVDLFRTAIKVGAFGTEAGDLATLEETLGNNEGLRDMVYDTLVTRGTVRDVSDREEQKTRVLDDIIRPGLSKMVSQGKNIAYKEMKRTMNQPERYPTEVRQVIDYIRGHLSPKEKEVQKFGEVFTPMSLVDEMLDTLPPEVWTDKTLTWLDPANGMGNYPIAVFLRLCYGTDCEGNVKTEGLQKVIPNEKARQKHIMEKMLYMVEINAKNMAVCRRLFEKLAPGAKLNLLQMNKVTGFLHPTMNFPVQSFDIVMGNPPYNSGGVRAKTTKKTRKREEDIEMKTAWIPFVEKVLDKHLNPGGYLLFIHPTRWFHPESSGIHERMMEKQIHVIRQYSSSDAKKLFSGKGEILLAYYLLQNKPVDSPTKMIDILNHTETLKLGPGSILCLAYNSIYRKVAKCPFFMDGEDLQSKPVKSCSRGLYPHILTIDQKGIIKRVRTNEKHEYQNTPKLFLFGYEDPRFYYDKTGHFGAIGNGHHYFIGDNLDKLEKYFKTRLAGLLLHYVKYRQKHIEPKFYPDVRSLPIDITDESLAAYFGFTQKERAAILSHPIVDREYTFQDITCDTLRKTQKNTNT